MAEIEKIVGEYTSSSDVEKLEARHERLVRGLSKACTTVFYESMYENDGLGNMSNFVGSAMEFVYPPQDVSEGIDREVDVPSSAEPIRRIETTKHEYDGERATGIIQVHLDINGSKVFFGFNSLPGKSDFSEKVMELIKRAKSSESDVS